MGKLTNAELERLAILSEELAEVSQLIGKIIRHGYESYHPDDPDTTNRQLLEVEIGHVNLACALMVDAKDIDPKEIVKSSEYKGISIKKWLHFQ